MAEECVLYDRVCENCGECDQCDLEEGKRCDDCGKCIESLSEYRTVDIKKFYNNKDKDK